jgi:Family of unknown function (DUF6427)
VIALFRSNQNVAVFLLALYVGLLHVPAFAQWVPLPLEGQGQGGILFELIRPFIEKNAVFSAILATVLVLIQAVLVNWVVSEVRMMPERNWLPGMLYAYFTACIPAFQYTTAPLMAATFIPLALQQVFRAYKAQQATTIVFDAGLWIAVAGLFYPPAVFLLIFTYISLNSLRSFSFREQAVFLCGAFVPGFLGWVACFWFDKGYWFRHIHFWGLFQYFDFSMPFNIAMQAASGWIGLLLLWVLLGYGRYMSKKLIQIQKYINALYWLIAVGGLSLLLRTKPDTVHLLLIAPAMGILLAMSVQSIRNRMVAEILHLGLLAVSVALGIWQYAQQNSLL